MADPRTEKLAKTLVQYSTGVQPGDKVFILSHTTALPLLKPVLRHVLEAGGHPVIGVENEELQEIVFRHSTDEQLVWVSPLERMAREDADVLIVLRAAENTHALSNIDPKKQQIYLSARSKLQETYMRRAAEGKLRWTLTVFPCQAYAQDADMSLREYEDFVYGATFSDQPDPVARWQEVHREQERLVEWLQGKKQVQVRGPNARLDLSIAGRTFINSDGHQNMPSGEVFTGPVEDSVNGWVRFTYPAVHKGVEVEGVELTFKEGRVVEARARKNEGFLHTMLDSDPGARYLGEFAIGTNYAIQKFTKNILFDEKIGGSIHMAVGAGYPQTGSKNKSSIHWDFICDMKNDSEIRVDGELFYKNGEFQV